MEMRDSSHHRSVYPDQPVEGLDNVIDLLERSHNHLDQINLSQFKPFSSVYFGVTKDVRASEASFIDTASLHKTSGQFAHHYLKQHGAWLDGRLDRIEPHWRIYYDDERITQVDKGTQLWIGMNNHIIGDLGRSALESGASKLYIDNDFRRVNGILWERAYKESAEFVPSFGHHKIRKTITDAAMFTIVAGREVALRDYRRMKRAQEKGDNDQVAEIVEIGHLRAAKIAKTLLTLSYKANEASGTLRHAS